MYELIKLAKNNITNKIRFCGHASPDDLIHEMFIVHPKDMYVRPHKHVNKSESMLVLNGEVDYILFNQDGDIEEVIELGDFNSKKDFYISTKEQTYHSLIIKSEWLVFLEITSGTFKKEDTIFAKWSPDINDISEIEKYVNKLKKAIK